MTFAKSVGKGGTVRFDSVVIPKDILLKIASFLRDAKSLCQFSMCCRTLYHLIAKDEIWEELFIQDFSKRHEKNRHDEGNVFICGRDNPRFLWKNRYFFSDQVLDDMGDRCVLHTAVRDCPFQGTVLVLPGVYEHGIGPGWTPPHGITISKPMTIEGVGFNRKYRTSKGMRSMKDLPSFDCGDETDPNIVIFSKHFTTLCLERCSANETEYIRLMNLHVAQLPEAGNVYTPAIHIRTELTQGKPDILSLVSLNLFFFFFFFFFFFCICVAFVLIFLV